MSTSCPIASSVVWVSEILIVGLQLVRIGHPRELGARADLLADLDRLAKLLEPPGHGGPDLQLAQLAVTLIVSRFLLADVGFLRRELAFFRLDRALEGALRELQAVDAPRRAWPGRA